MNSITTNAVLEHTKQGGEHHLCAILYHLLGGSFEAVLVFPCHVLSYSRCTQFSKAFGNVIVLN